METFVLACPASGEYAVSSISRDHGPTREKLFLTANIHEATVFHAHRYGQIKKQAKEMGLIQLPATVTRVVTLVEEESAQLYTVVGQSVFTRLPRKLMDGARNFTGIGKAAHPELDYENDLVYAQKLVDEHGGMERFRLACMLVKDYNGYFFFYQLGDK